MPDIVAAAASSDCFPLCSSGAILEVFSLSTWTKEEHNVLNKYLAQFQAQKITLREFYELTLRDINNRRDPKAVSHRAGLSLDYFNPEDDAVLKQHVFDIFDKAGPGPDPPVGMYRKLHDTLPWHQAKSLIRKRCEELGFVPTGGNYSKLSTVLPCHELFPGCGRKRPGRFYYASRLRSIYQALIDVFSQCFSSSTAEQTLANVATRFRNAIMQLHRDNRLDLEFARSIASRYAHNNDINFADRNDGHIRFDWSKSELEDIREWLQKYAPHGKFRTRIEFFTALANHLEDAGHQRIHWKSIEIFLTSRLKIKLVTMAQLHGKAVTASGPLWTQQNIQTYIQPILIPLSTAIDEAGLNHDEPYLRIAKKTTSTDDNVHRRWGFSELQLAHRVLCGINCVKNLAQDSSGNATRESTCKGAQGCMARGVS